MRKLLVSVLVPVAMSASSAVVAQTPTADEIVSVLPHPYDVEEAGDRLGAAIGAIVNLPIGDVLRAVDPASRASANATIGDLAGRDDAEFENRLRNQVRGLSNQASNAVRGLSAAAPALERALARLERDLSGALGGLAR